MVATHDRKYDLVVFGASGFTGAFVVKHIAATQAALSAQLKRPLRWAVAGRSRARITPVLKEYDADVPIIECDVFDAEGLFSLATSAYIVLNCVGPYRYFGEPVVTACVAAGTNYVDITGEPEFIEKMYLKFNALATETGTTLVPACGFDSMPCDLGVMYTKAKMLASDMVPVTMDMYLALSTGPAGFVGHYATYESAVQGFASVGSLRAVRKLVAAVRPRAVPVSPLKAAVHGGVHWNGSLARYTVPFPGSDASVVRMGQECVAVMGAKDALPAVHFAAYVGIKRWWNVAGLATFATVLGTLTRWKWGRWILLKFPRLCSFGMFSHAGPSAKQLAQTSFSETFVGRGLSTANNAELHDHALRAGGDAAEHEAVTQALRGATKLDSELITKVSGPEPGYVATPIFLLAGAVTILLEKDGSTIPSGVLTPASAFFRTSIIQRLKDAGIEFSVVSKRRL
ncbi:Saccharopine dehydrogenase-domain-containing protein [Blastocladiella britannica]|nr:Saccharopine dehydrogenase-domain-containing protein [Blastocladiella britannica]